MSQILIFNRCQIAINGINYTRIRLIARELQTSRASILLPLVEFLSKLGKLSIPLNWTNNRQQ